MKHAMTLAVAVGLALAATLSSASATQLLRTFVSPTGNDANDCSLGAPCRHLQAALAQTLGGGEIAVLGSAGYNGGTTVTIDKAVSIVNPGAFEAGIFAPSEGAAIVINAGANDVVSLRGLTVEGGGVGNYGIIFNSGKSLLIDNCVVEKFNSFHGFPGTGILIQPTSGTMNFVIKNTTVSYNQTYGIAFLPPSGSPAATILIDHVTAIGNGDGIVINTVIGGSARAGIVNSVASNNTTGIVIVASVSVSIDNVNITGNDEGIYATGNAFAFLGRSTVENNASTGIDNATGPNNFYTHQDNHINGNGTDINGTLVAAPPR